MEKVRCRSAALLGRVVAVGVALVVAIVTGAVAPAAAHDVVLKATPADGSTVSRFPRTIVLEFSGIPKANFNTVAVSNAETKKVLFTAQPELKQQIVTVPVPDDIHPGDGTYIVGFQITSSDGHATRGKTTFSVRAAHGSQASTPTPQAPETTATKAEEQSSSLGLLVGIGALIVIAAGLVATVFRKRNKNAHHD